MQFCVYRNKGKNKAYPYLLEVQSPLADDYLGAKLVIPLAKSDFFSSKIPERMFPLVVINGQQYRLITADIVAAPNELFGDKVADLRHQSDLIKGAIDFMFHGF